MGYQSTYDIYMKDVETNADVHGDIYDKLIIELEELVDEEIQYSCKWYECENDMMEFSKRYPQYYFKIFATGEDGAIDAFYTWNGKIQGAKPRIVMDDFNLINKGDK